MMKTILVLTDFSKNARSAEEYAMRLAIQVKANIILFNAYPIHTIPVSDTLLWPHDEPVSLELQSISNLQSRVNELKDELAKIQGNGFKPSITHLGDASPLTTRINDVVIENSIWMVIMGTRGEGFANNVLFGSNVFKVLDNIDCPMLIIPQDIEYKGLQKIAYATDLRSSYPGIIDWLKQFSEMLKSDLFIVHVSKEIVSTEDDSGKIITEQLLNKTTPGDTRIRYFQGKNVKDSLHEITEEMNVDMLALMHRKYGFFDSLFHASTSHKMIKHTQIPILIFPEIM